MDDVLSCLRAAAEPTRLRLLALVANGSFCVSEMTQVLGQSQPRLSRHLKLLCEAGLLERVREGVNVWFALPGGRPGELARTLLSHLPEDDPLLIEDRRHATRVIAERARAASDIFHRQGADWDEIRALKLPGDAVASSLKALLPEPWLGRLIDIGTGTGSVLELFPERLAAAIGFDASRTMLALARSRLAKPGLEHCSVRQGDMYRLPVATGNFDIAILQMVLHYAEDPAAALAEAARVLRPGGRLIVIDLAAHQDKALAERFGHLWLGFGDGTLNGMFKAAGLEPQPSIAVSGALQIRLWPALRVEHAQAAQRAA